MLVETQRWNQLSIVVETQPLNQLVFVVQNQRLNQLVFVVQNQRLTQPVGLCRGDTVLPGRWIGRASGNDQPLMLWPPRSPDITLCDCFLWRCVKDRVFVPLLPRDLADLKARIIAAVKNIDAPMLTRVCGKNLNIRIDVCRVTRDAHIEFL